MECPECQTVGRVGVNVESNVVGSSILSITERVSQTRPTGPPHDLLVLMLTAKDQVSDFVAGFDGKMTAMPCRRRTVIRLNKVGRRDTSLLPL